MSLGVFGLGNVASLGRTELHYNAELWANVYGFEHFRKGSC